MKCLHGTSKDRGYICDNYAHGKCFSGCLLDTATLLLKIIGALQRGEEIGPDDREFLEGLREACGVGEEQATETVSASDKNSLPVIESGVCASCGGSGVISYNPNLNPNAFPATASAKCTRCCGET
jgi:hypothetical protein